MLLTIIIVLSLTIGFESCLKEEVSNDYKREHFYKKMGDEVSASGLSIVNADNGGVMMCGTSLSFDSFFIVNTNKVGQVEWQKGVKTKAIMWPVVEKLNNGHYMVSSERSPEVLMISSDGTVAFNTEFKTSLLDKGYRFSSTVEGDDGNYYISYTNGHSAGTDNNYISIIDENIGKENNYYRFTDSRMMGKVILFELTKVENDKAWVVGGMLNKLNWTYGDPRKVFVSVIHLNSSITDVNVLNVNDDSKSDHLVGHTPTSDGNAVALFSTGSYKYSNGELSSNYFEIAKFDESAAVIWQKKIDIGVVKIFPTSINEMKNGNLLVSGSCEYFGSVIPQPFFVIINQTGDVVYSKIFPVQTTTYFLDGIQTQDNSFLFTGYSYGFGKGYELADPIIMRTDELGNYK